MKTVVLAGGLGTRLAEETSVRPKPMIEIGGRPILWHIMKIYDHFGLRDFLIAGGYKIEVIKEYLHHFSFYNNDWSLHLPISIARCGNIYGAGDLQWSRIVPGTIRSLLRGERPIIRSDGQFVRDYVYVDDAAEACLELAAAADRDGVRGEAFNFGPAEPLTVLRVVDEIRRLVAREDLEPVVLNEASGEIFYLDSTKARERLGWSPRHGLEEGLRRTIAWYRDLLGESTPS